MLKLYKVYNAIFVPFQSGMKIRKYYKGFQYSLQHIPMQHFDKYGVQSQQHIF